MVENCFSGLSVIHDGMDVLEEDALLREVGVRLDEGESSLEIHCEACSRRVRTEKKKNLNFMKPRLNLTPN